MSRRDTPPRPRPTRSAASADSTMTDDADSDSAGTLARWVNGEFQHPVGQVQQRPEERQHQRHDHRRPQPADQARHHTDEEGGDPDEHPDRRHLCQRRPHRRHEGRSTCGSRRRQRHADATHEHHNGRPDEAEGEVRPEPPPPHRGRRQQRGDTILVLLPPGPCHSLHAVHRGDDAEDGHHRRDERRGRAARLGGQDFRDRRVVGQERARRRRDRTEEGAADRVRDDPADQRTALQAPVQPERASERGRSSR